MTDTELLEAAAKAAGLSSQGYEESRYGHFLGLSIREDNYPGGYTWNPLANDGDALRLAVKLGLVIDTSRPSAAQPFKVHEYEQTSSSDIYAATRRAIVRAAASLTKQP